MNNFRQAVQKVAQQAAKNGAPGGPGLPQAPKGLGTAFSILLGLGLASYGAYNSMVTIQPGHAGLVYNRFGGLDDKTVLTEGLNFVLPWVQRAIVFDVRTRPQPIDTQSGSKGKSYFHHRGIMLSPTLLCLCSRSANGANLPPCALQARRQQLAFHLSQTRKR